MRSGFVFLAVFLVVFTREAVCVVITNLKDYCTRESTYLYRCEGLNFGNFDDVEFDISTKFDCEDFNYTNSNFLTIPRNAFRISNPVDYFYMVNCSLKYIHKWNFYSGQSSVKTRRLYLDYNQIEKIPSEVFEYIPKLETLRLGANKLSTLEINCFKGLKSLAHLNMSQNHIEALREDVFDELTNLGLIDLRNNRLQFLPGNIFKNNGQLKDIYLQDNHLKIIDINVIRSSAARKFLLTNFNESIQITPVTVLDVSSALRVFVDRNFFPYISSTSLTKMTALRIFNARGVNLTYIEDGAFSHMPKLETIDLEDNLLETFKFDLVSNLRHLEKLNIKKNRLKTFDYRPNHNPNLTFIAIEDNLFSCDHRKYLTQNLRNANVPSDLKEQNCRDITSTPKTREYTETTSPAETSSELAVLPSEQIESITELPFVANLCSDSIQNQTDHSMLLLSVITLTTVLIILFGVGYLLWSSLRRSYVARNFQEADIAVRLVETKS